MVPNLGSATPSTGTLISKKRVVVKIQEIADYKKVDGRSGRLWIVKPEILQQVQWLFYRGVYIFSNQVEFQTYYDKFSYRIFCK